MIWHWKSFRGASLTLAILMWVLFACVFAQDASECTMWVQPGKSIQEAIDQAAEGTVICLAAGTWEENLKVEKSLILRGAEEGETIVRAAIEGYPVIWIEGSQENREITVAISDLTSIGGYGECPASGIYADGVLVRGTAHANLTDCTISENYSGIGLLDSSQTTVSGCTISENYAGIGLWDSPQATISDCNISENTDDGIWLEGTAQATIDHNEITNNKYGIALYQRPCYDNDEVFAGRLSGSGNLIPGPDELDGNQEGTLCPDYPGDPWPDGFLKEE